MNPHLPAICLEARARPETSTLLFVSSRAVGMWRPLHVAQVKAVHGKQQRKARCADGMATGAGGSRDAQKTGISSSLIATPSPKSGCKFQSRLSAAMPSSCRSQTRRHGIA